METQLKRGSNKIEDAVKEQSRKNYADSKKNNSGVRKRLGPNLDDPSGRNVLRTSKGE